MHGKFVHLHSTQRAEMRKNALQKKKYSLHILILEFVTFVSHLMMACVGMFVYAFPLFWIRVFDALSAIDWLKSWKKKQCEWFDKGHKLINFFLWCAKPTFFHVSCIFAEPITTFDNQRCQSGNIVCTNKKKAFVFILSSFPMWIQGMEVANFLICK